jgi:hypothetical protein
MENNTIGFDHVLIDGRQYSNTFDIPSFGGAVCDTNHYLVAAKSRLSISKRAAQKLDVDRFNLNELNYMKSKNSIRLKSQVCSFGKRG